MTWTATLLKTSRSTALSVVKNIMTRNIAYALHFLMLDNPLEKGHAFWTSLTSKGCIGRFKSCCHKSTNKSDAINKIFWELIFSMDAGGCIVLAEFNSGLDVLSVNYNYIPRITSCGSKANFACEVDGRVSDYLRSHLPSKVYQ